MSETPSTEIVWIGRFTGPKGELAESIMQQIAPNFPQLHFSMIGGPLDDRLQAMCPANVTLCGFVSDVMPYIANADAVIGAGRVALEAMRAARPVLAVGENRYHGWINAENIAAAKSTNFGDCDEHHAVDLQQFKRDLEGFVQGTIQVDTSRYAEYLQDYTPEQVYPSVMRVYNEARIDQYLSRFKEIPILTYHRVVASAPQGSHFNIYVTTDELDQQIESLHKRGYQTITFADIVNGVKARKPVFLTFDDGYEDNYLNLLPLLRKHNARATIFALSNRQKLTNYWDVARGEPAWPLMTDEQLRACADSGYIEIASHGVNHTHLPQLDDKAVRDEIHQSRTQLSELLQKEVFAFAYPYGDYGQREAELVAQAGYYFGIGTVNGPVQAAADRYRIRRITMFRNTSLSAFRKKTSGWYLRYCKLKGKDF